VSDDVTYRKATQDDVYALVPRLRPADIVECETLFGQDSALRSVMFGLHDDAEALVAERDGVVIAVFGVCPGGEPGVGVPWMVGSVEIEKCSRQMIRDSIPRVRSWLKEFRRLENVVDSRNEKSIRWLRRLGFTIYPPEPIGLSGELFHRFDMMA